MSLERYCHGYKHIMRFEFRYISILAMLVFSVCDAKNLHYNDNTFQRRDIEINLVKVGKFKRQSSDGKSKKNNLYEHQFPIKIFLNILIILFVNQL